MILQFIFESEHFKARFRRRTSHEPNRMQMKENKGFCSFAFDSAHVKNGVWTWPQWLSEQKDGGNSLALWELKFINLQMQYYKVFSWQQLFYSKQINYITHPHIPLNGQLFKTRDIILWLTPLAFPSNKLMSVFHVSVQVLIMNLVITL